MIRVASFISFGAGLLLAFSPTPTRAAAVLADFDFTRPEVAREWHADRHIAALTPTAEGLRVALDGFDPYFSGPARDYPADTAVWVQLRLKSSAGGGAQLFYYATHPAEEHSVRFQVAPGGWRDVRLRLPALGPGFRFRLDPPGTNGTFVLASLQVTAAPTFRAPAWTAPGVPKLVPEDPTLVAGSLQLTHSREALGAFELRVEGRPMALGHSAQQVGYLRDNRLHWFTLSASNATRVAVRREGEALVATGEFVDPHRNVWRFTQQFTLAAVPDAIDVECTLAVSADQSVVFAPLFTLLPGAGTFGTNKHQGLFAGLEYLDNEPSRSEADLRGPAAFRLVPDTLKITFPLMAIAAENRYVGLTWGMQPSVSALFDSPDRTLQGGGHALALIFPGADALNRDDGQLLPRDGARLAASQSLRLHVTLLGGTGRSVVPAVRQYVNLRGLPPLPTPPSLDDYVRLAAGGWLDSKCREGTRYRHAVWPGFNAQPAADAAFYLDWLAQQTPEGALAARLRQAGRDALAEVPPASWYDSAVSHVRYPLVPLVYGHIPENARQAARVARQLLSRFEPDGRVLYRPSPDRPNYGATHFAPDANGLTAQVVASLLEAAVFCGDPELIPQALARLRALDAFRDTVPRGAQTWECPLHTPDVLASAHLVHAYTLGYELTGDAALLGLARHWAWTGVPFVYLRDPTEQQIGRYLTPPVYGATGWAAPVWMGLPVQWCGLVYADALYRLVRHDPRGVWKQLADGITLGGVQVSWPLDDRERQGLLPDVFHLRDQQRDGPAINPGTVQSCAARWYTRQPLYDFCAIRERGWRVHAPGAIADVRLQEPGARFTVDAWPKQPAYVLVNGLSAAPRLKLNGRATPIEAPHQYSEGRLVLQVEGRTVIEVMP